MRIIRADSAGFCWGVERAINIAEDYSEKGYQNVYTDGPLIHNNQMMEKLSQKGVQEVGSYEGQGDLSISQTEKEKSVIVVRAHGIPPERRKYLKNLGLKFRDATCPDVSFIAGKIRTHDRRGYRTVIFGDAKHPEVVGLLGYTSDGGYPIKTKEDIDALPDLGEKVILVSQSTMFTHEFLELGKHLQLTYPSAVIIDTICGATKDRQKDLKTITEEGAEAIIVIGGQHSANTRKLALLARQQNLPTYHIETAMQLDMEEMAQYECVGVTAGASTPIFIIDEVCKKLEKIGS